MILGRARLNRCLTELIDLRARHDAVLALHYKAVDETTHVDHYACLECGVAWPCPTVELLGVSE